jgi:hypothetical protein
MKDVGQRGVVFGGLIVATVINVVPVETCERGGVTACPTGRVEWNHDRDPEPEAPPMLRQGYVMGTSTVTAMTIGVPGI